MEGLGVIDWMVDQFYGGNEECDTQKCLCRENYLESLDELLSYQQVKRNYKNE